MPGKTQPLESKDISARQRRVVKAMQYGPLTLPLEVGSLVLQQAIADPAQAQPAGILGLQKDAGNRVVSRLIQTEV
jgi:hypothetical protein